MRSKGETRVLAALKLLGNYTIQEQKTIGRLRLDFFVKELSLAVECDGIQHEEFNMHYFESKEAFKDAQQRDRLKEKLCEQAGITLVRLDYKFVMKAKDANEILKEILARKTEAQVYQEDGW